MSEDYTKSRKKLKKRAPSNGEFDDIQRISQEPQSAPRNLPNISGNQDEEQKVAQNRRVLTNNEKIMRKVQSGQMTPTQQTK